MPRGHTCIQFGDSARSVHAFSSTTPPPPSKPPPPWKGIRSWCMAAGAAATAAEYNGRRLQGVGVSNTILLLILLDFEVLAAGADERVHTSPGGEGRVPGWLMPSDRPRSTARASRPCVVNSVYSIRTRMDGLAIGALSYAPLVASIRRTGEGTDRPRSDREKAPVLQAVRTRTRGVTPRRFSSRNFLPFRPIIIQNYEITPIF